ncbi:MAG: vitamin K epoxide reductase family protein [Akkermansiaceae bacterium]
MKAHRFYAVRILALIGLGISLYLLIQKLNGTITSIKGCGDEGGCESVLGSKWSQWFGIPVSAFSTLLYGAFLCCTTHPKPFFLRLAAFLLIGAAIWFVGLQIFVIRSFCPWCVVTHSVGLLTAILTLRSLSKTAPTQQTAPLVSLTVLSMVALVLGQVLGPKPETNLMTEESLSPESEAEVGEKSGRMIDIGGKTVPMGEEPFIGPPDAPFVLVKYFDYTCGSCRDLEGDLEALMKKYPARIAVILSPTPLNRTCNPHVPARVKDHLHACELSRLGMAAWLAKPEEFLTVHRLLFSHPVLSPKRAHEEVAEIVGEEALAEALKSPAIDTTIKENTEDFKKLTSRTVKMPKLMLGGGKMMHGLARDQKTFIRQVEGALNLTDQ